MSIFESLAKAEEHIEAGYPVCALAELHKVRKALINEMADALCQGGDTRKVGEELQLGHFCTSTWESIAWDLVEHGGYEWVDPDAKYWIREKL